MANKYLQLLQRHQIDIVKDLDVKYILDELFTKGAITSDDFYSIFNISQRNERARYLITTLMQKIQNGNPSSFEVFVNSLAKDYNWLWEKLSVDTNESMLNESFEDSLSKGDVPRFPKHYVGREALEKEITAKLQLLTRHNVLVLHGMLGSGKTTLAISVLRHNPELINENFGGVVFWLDMKDCKTEDDIIAQQNKLFRKISLIVDTPNSLMTSSISMSSVGSNADSQSLSMCDWTWRELRDKLKNQFTGHMIKDALLVLDEVSETKCAEAFDVGCKMLITTRDAGVVSSFNAQIVNVSNTFSEKETLQVFAKILDIDVSQLPPQAKQLHKICKGSPFHIGLMGSQLAESRERLIHDPKHWSYFINMFKKKDFLPFLPRHNDYNPMKTIEVCVNSLPPNILILFKKLTIFPDSARVTVEVLSKLWHKSTYEVSDIAKTLSSKSLITGSYEPEKKDYTYVIHDLIMNYLRKCLDNDEIKRLHSDFLNSYGYGNVDSVTMDIVDDGYIAFYIGHHILKTENLNKKWSLFGKLFLDLRFLGNKVRLTGPADVLLDLQKYEMYIAHGDNIEKDLLLNVKAFLSTHGTDLYRYPSTDIVQSILQHESKGVLYTKAADIASRNCQNHELVFEFLHEQNVEEVKHSTIDVKETITVVCFLGNYVLVGTSSGMVKCFHLATNTLKLEVPISTTPLKWVGPCPQNPTLVAALAYDGVVKIWYFEDLDEEDGYCDSIDEDPEIEFETPDRNRSLKQMTGPFMNCRWMNHSETLLTHTQNQIQIYSAIGERQRVIDITDKEILCCTPCSYDRYVIAACISMGKDNVNSNTVEVIDKMAKKVAVFEETDTIMDLLSIKACNRIITLKEKEIMQHDFKLSTSYQNNIICHSKEVLNTSSIRDCLTFLSMAVNKAGSFLFVSTNDSRVIGVDLRTNTKIIYLENKRGNVISMSVSEIRGYVDFTPGPDVLVTGTGDIEKCVKVWYLDPAVISHKQENVRLTTDFDTSFLNLASPVTPNNTPSNGAPNIAATRHDSFIHRDVDKPTRSVVKGTKSLDRYPLKPLNLKGICNGNSEGGFQPFLAVVDDKNNIQLMRGRKILTEIPLEHKENITIVRISPCNHYIFYGTSSGTVKKITLRTKEVSIILDINSAVQYMEFVNPYLLIVSGKNKCMIGYKMVLENFWQAEMMYQGNTNLGSQELLDTIGGVKMNGQSDKVSISTQDQHSIGSRYEKTGLIATFWLKNIGLITVESNSTIKLWGQDLKVVDILYPRQMDVLISRATFQKNVLAICDDRSRGFQTFDVKTVGNRLQLYPIEEVKLLNCISSCDLTSDGNILALGLDNGDIVVWNVRTQLQLCILRQHKTKVQYCSFSPVPERLYQSNSIQSPNANSMHQCTINETNEDQPPLVLVTMASEVVWWNITYKLEMIAKRLRDKPGVRGTVPNVISPIVSPIPHSLLSPNLQDMPSLDNMTISENSNFFFGDGLSNSKRCWTAIWKNKTHKDGAKRKEILACIKLSGMSAKRLCHNEEFSCFTTVDNAGQVHIMNIMRQPNT